MNSRNKKLQRKEEISNMAPAVKPFYQKYALLILILIPLVLYFRVVFLEYTQLDDSMFISGSSGFNSHLGNIVASFQRGLFQPGKSVYYDYYRPFFLIDILIEYQLFGDNAMWYHLTNLFFHIVSVCLLYVFLKSLRLPVLNALILSLIFAVHPVLSQAVSWIPGRNDMLLMILFLSGMIVVIYFVQTGKWYLYLLQVILFLGALFTKETSVIIPVLGLILLLFIVKAGWKTTTLFLVGWILSILFFFFVKSNYGPAGGNLPYDQMIGLAIKRWPAYIQYLGKIFLPFNLSVFPYIEDISLFWGICAGIILTGLVIYSRSYFNPLTIFGAIWFVLFLLPVLVMPKYLAYQVFEHRLYIPVVGILIILSQTILFSGKMKDTTKMLIYGFPLLILAIMSFSRIGYFKDPPTFWTKAVEDSPKEGFPKLILGSWTRDEVLQETLLEQASALDTNLQNVNLFLGRIKYKKKDYDKAEFYFKKELKFSQLSEVYMDLAHIAFIKNDLDKASFYLQKVAEIDPGNLDARNNLVMLFLQTGHKDKAREVLDDLKRRGITLSPALENISKQL
jgi:protein O-mannosyl-transferase